jgi:hypothetical protein
MVDPLGFEPSVLRRVTDLQSAAVANATRDPENPNDKGRVMVLKVGLEPTTYGVQNRCST